MKEPGRRRARAPAISAVLVLAGAMLACPGWFGAGTAHAATPWGADYFPNVPLVSHEGKALRFFDDLIKDKVVAINFIYTLCPDVCPLETARMREVQELLGDRIGRDIFIYSISVDPKNDTPEVLKKYAEQYDVGPGWLFLTGKEADITLLRRKLGLYDDTTPGDKVKNHDVSTIIGNQATGRWIKVSPYENPYVIANKLGDWLHNWKPAAKGRKDYADAPALRNISRGETLFRTRCASCHTIGEAGMVKTDKRQLGPDLADVTRRRDREWLYRYVAEPDKVRAEKDPIATTLMAEYNNVLMPNLRLESNDVQALLAFIEEESGRARNRHPAGRQEAPGGEKQ